MSGGSPHHFTNPYHLPVQASSARTGAPFFAPAPPASYGSSSGDSPTTSTGTAYGTPNIPQAQTAALYSMWSPGVQPQAQGTPPSAGSAGGGSSSALGLTAPASAINWAGTGLQQQLNTMQADISTAPKSEGFEDLNDDYDDDAGSDPSAQVGPGEDKDGGEVKKKSTRGSRACTVCRKLKMRCVGAEEGPPCKRCKTGNHECIFEESMRGRRTNRKTDAMAKSLRKMEATLETVLKSISQPGLLNSAGGLSDSALVGRLSPSLSLPPLPAVGGGIHDGLPGGDLQVGPSASTSSAPSSNHHHSVSFLQQIPTASSSSSHQQPHALAMTAHSVPGPHQSTGSINVESPSTATPSGSAAGGQAGSNAGGGGEFGSIDGWSGVRGNEDRSHEPRLHSLPDNVLNPLGLLAEASLQNTRKRTMTLNEVLDASRGAVDDSDTPDRKRTKLGVANASYFSPGPMNILPLRRIVIEHRMPPALLIEKIVSIEEVVELFTLYFEKCHFMCPILDPDVHTPTATGSRSPFLFTCICSVAARYYTKRTDDLYRKCLRVAKRVAFDVMTKGFKSTEICQGFLLLCQWNQPAERFEEERTYQFSGIAIRMATDLNLHRKTLAVLPAECPEDTRIMYQREIMNRERTWLYAFIADRSISTQMGKPYSIPKEDFIIRNAKSWHREPGAQKTDVGLSAMVEMHRIVGRIVDTLYSDTRSVSGLNAHLDYTLLMRSFLGQLDQWRTDWTVAFAIDPDDLREGQRAQMRDFYHSYYRLFLLSFAIQHALDNPESTIDLASYVVMCFESASTIITIARDYFGPKGFLRYAIDGTYVYLSYAATFLLKLVNPTFSNLVDATTAMALVKDAADTLQSCAVDDTHTPALYASFLRALIENKRTGGRTAPASRVPTQPNSPVMTAANLENFVKSRAGSVGPEGLFASLMGGAGDSTVPVAGTSGDPNEFAAFDSLAMDTMLSNGGFWENMLLPGYGGPLQGLSGGTGMMLGGGTDPWSLTPLHSRPGSPNGTHGTHPPVFDFGPLES
ncbi:hypothetical protein T439DRAFT_380294 [Meredithblackwellia eburnea MCA 4105]